MIESVWTNASYAEWRKFPSAPLSISDIYYTLIAEFNSVDVPEVRASLVRLGEFEGWLPQVRYDYKAKVGAIHDWVVSTGQPMTLEQVYATLSQHTEHLSEDWLKALERLEEFSLGSKKYLN